jgi:hypothetical protein
MRDFEILEHLGLWEDKTPVERAPPVSIPEKNYEPYDDGRSLPPVAYLAAVQKNRLSRYIESEYKVCHFGLRDWCAFFLDFCVVRSLVNSLICAGYVVDRPDFFVDRVSGYPLLVNL